MTYCSNFLINTFVFGLLTAGFMRQRQILVGLAAVPLAWMVFSVLFYLYMPGFWDHAEPSVAASTAYWMSGHALYSALDSAARYSLIYGPFPFFVNRLAFSVWPSDIILASKLTGVLFFLITATSITALVRRQEPTWRMRIVFLGLFSAALLGFENMSYWNRPDSYLLAMVAFLLWLIEVTPIEQRRWFYLCCGILVGCAINTKIHGFFYFFPLVPYLRERRPDLVSLKGCAMAAAVAGVVAISFFSLPQVSLSNYIEWMNVATHVARTWDNFFKTLTFVFPGLLILWLLRFQQKYFWTFLTLTGTCVVTGIFASKIGAGYHHSLPLMPFFFYFLLLALKSGSVPESFLVRWILSGLACASIYEGYMGQKYFISMLQTTRMHVEVRRDFEAVMNRYPGPVELGYANSDTYASTFLRPLLVFNRGEILIDPPAYMEMLAAGVAMPEETLQALDRCTIGYFIFPKEGQPWSMRSFYEAELLPQQFRKLFQRRYQLIESSRYYSVYKCLRGV